ncbi:TOPRIM nucleotidyl transferase/hydrolase domain-containing protein, partial [Sphingobium cupriresistens]|uniref:TOPRIM nucleotidyl transferase/hydrolase domain-containing protein n=1 Tax=Sphingobium cupriresistens TaxID=1132417 RepID=UPI001A935358
GIIDSQNRTIKIIRITRNENINNVKILDNDYVSSISNDPVVRYSGIFESIFYKNVIFCESDADCQFYRAVLGSKSVSGEVEPDALFIQTSGKHKMVKLADIAKGLGVPFSMILDIDVLNDKKLFQTLFETAGGRWGDIQSQWKNVYDAINGQKSSLSPSQIIAAIEEAFSRLRSNKISLSQFISEIKDYIKSNSPWDNVKRAGRSSLPPGPVVENFDSVLKHCGNFGIWIVPIGELEGFCRSITNKKGNEWIVELLEKRNIEESPELSEAREFVRKLCNKASAKLE